MWGILNTLNAAEVEEVTIDALANWKPAKSLAGIKTEEENECKRATTKAMSPGSMNMPTMNNWDLNQAMSPYIPVTPDMNSIVSGSMMNNASSATYANNSINHRNTSGGTYEINSGTNTSGNNDYNGPGPLSHLNESVNSLDPLNAMEKSLNDQVRRLVISTQACEMQSRVR